MSIEDEWPLRNNLSDKIKIVRAIPQDSDEIADIHARAFEEMLLELGSNSDEALKFTFGNFGLDKKNLRNRMVDYWRQAVQEDRLVVALDDDTEKVIGFGASKKGRVDNDELPRTLERALEAMDKVDGLYVTPHMRRRRIGRALLEVIEKELGTEIYLTTTVDSGAVEFYKRAGYREMSWPTPQPINVLNNYDLPLTQVIMYKNKNHPSKLQD